MKGFYPKQGSSGFKHEGLHVSSAPPPLTLPLSAPGMHPVIANWPKFKIHYSLDVILLLRNYGITFHKERLSKQENTRSGGRGWGAECRKEFYCNFILKIFKK